MKLLSFPLMLLFMSLSCNTSEDAPVQNSNLPAKEMLNIAYGTDGAQKMDVYLPANRTANTKVFILVHGGGWSGGSKAEFSYFVPILKAHFPDYAIVNMNYRLATIESPAFPKQVQDIASVVDYIKNSDYNVSIDLAFIGASAGAHLSMLYSYKYDADDNVKAVCNIVGPADFTDPAYMDNPMFQYGAYYLIGNVNWQQNPGIITEVSPALQVTPDSAPTIMFYGGQDPLIPVTQATRLKAKLDENGVYNEYYLYAAGGHGNWDLATMNDFQAKLIAFFNAKF